MRKNTPDVLGKVMGEKEPARNKTVKPASNKETKQENHKAIKKASNKTSKQESNKTINTSRNIEIKQENENTPILDDFPKEKATFNLSVVILSRLEDVWMKLRRSGKDQRITKTLIVEKSIEIILNDYDSKGIDSQLFKNT